MHEHVPIYASSPIDMFREARKSFRKFSYDEQTHRLKTFFEFWGRLKTTDSSADNNELGRIFFADFLRSGFSRTNLYKYYLPDFRPDNMQIFYTEKYALRVNFVNLNRTNQRMCTVQYTLILFLKIHSFT